MLSCDECGFEYDSVAVGDIGPRLRAGAAELVDVLRVAVDDDLRRRPAPGVWSPLEYTCHVRDVLEVQLGRVALAMVVDCPSFEPMQRDERPERLKYNAQDPVVVAEQLTDAAAALALVFERMTDDHLARTVTYNWPEEMIRPLRWVGRHTIHELLHHRLDIERAGASPP